MSKLVEYLFMENESRLARLVHENTVPKRIPEAADGGTLGSISM
jgi:hypothetical protein